MSRCARARDPSGAARKASSRAPASSGVARSCMAGALGDVQQHDDAEGDRHVGDVEGRPPRQLDEVRDATVADALAHVRNPDLTPALAALVYVCRPPLETPTGRFLGLVHIQRLLRDPPHASIGSIVDKDLEPLTPDAPIGRVTRMLATYNLVGVPVVDEVGRLVGAVTVDDVLDHLLPEDWREERHEEPHDTSHEVTHGP